MGMNTWVACIVQSPHCRETNKGVLSRSLGGVIWIVHLLHTDRLMRVRITFSPADIIFHNYPYFNRVDRLLLTFTGPADCICLLT